MHIPLTAPQLPELVRSVSSERLAELFGLARSGAEADYPHWDKVAHLTPPVGLTSREWWLALKLGRSSVARTVPLLDTTGVPFHFTTPDTVLRSLHQLDQQLAGRIGAPDALTGATRDRYIVTSLMEEAITSSQLEGAVTSRRVAKELLRSGRPPRDISERMIFNNFAAMQHVRRISDRPLTPELICELHRQVTLDTLDDPASAGRVELPGEQRVRIWAQDDQLLHTPPPAEQLPGRLQALCDFANGTDAADDATFVHPVLRAVILHFWMGYDHYFVDGNGRTARAVFYWSMLHEGYWLAEFLTISNILRRARVSYAQSFLLTETDGNDLTYFVIHQLDVLSRAVRALEDYLARKADEIGTVERLMRDGSSLNHRQRAVLGRALRDADATFTIAAHMAEHRVVYQTARTDLLDLAERGLVAKDRRGNAFVFTTPSELSERLRNS